MRIETDFLIIGSGIAGLFLGIRLSKIGHVIVVTKKARDDTATSLAQGGIACVCSGDDSIDLHIFDTLKAGDGLCHEMIVELVAKRAREAIASLEDIGVSFKKDKDGSYSLHREGGHSRRRVLHCNDYTGKNIQKILSERLLDSNDVLLLENHIAVDLITEGKIERHFVNRQKRDKDKDYNDYRCDKTNMDFSQRGKQPERCMGAYVLDADNGDIYTIAAPITILATGGAGKVYLYTSNPDVATGDGIVMAWRAGARVANLEFVQFHPTCLYHPLAKNFLISEALRGEGALLINSKGRRFMEDYAPSSLELSSRDVVARAIDMELKRTGDDCVYLDATRFKKDFIISKFPNIYSTCLKFGLDIVKDPIPVVPAAHYMCGGIVTDRFARTDIEGLYAVGECACTGLHGANRLASNSLLEGVVMAMQAFKKIFSEREALEKRFLKCPMPPEWDSSGAVDLREGVLISYNWDVIRRLMWNYVGIVRNDKRLNLAKKRLAPIIDEIDGHYWEYLLTSDFVELRNIAHLAMLIVESAILRKESRGGHFNEDHPQKDDWNWRRDTVLKRNTCCF